MFSSRNTEGLFFSLFFFFLKKDQTSTIFFILVFFCGCGFGIKSYILSKIHMTCICFFFLGEPPAREFSRRISTDVTSHPKLTVLPLSPNQTTTSTPPKSFSGSPPSRLVSPPQRAPPPYPHPPPPPAPVIYNNGPKMVNSTFF